MTTNSTDVADVTALDMLMTKFIADRQYLKNVTPATLRYYHECWRVWGPTLPSTPADLTKPVVVQALRTLLEGGNLSNISINTYLRGLNAILKWMHEEGHLPSLIHIKAIKAPQKATPVFNEEQVRRFVQHKPTSSWARRAQALAVFIVDSGARISEALFLTREQLDLDNLLVRLKGKGRKERIVPISPECRKIVFQWLRSHPHDLVFATSTGTAMSHTNSSRDFKKLCGALKIEGVRTSWHTLRHTFATHYIRGGGDVFRLQRTLGHTQLSVTQKYVQVQTEDLTSVHSRLSLVSAAGRRS